MRDMKPFEANTDVIFPSLDCVILASGFGRRFGSNKLMAPFLGQPMLLQILEATEGLFRQRIVVSRYEEAAELARERGCRVILHDLPLRSDTVRLGIGAAAGSSGCMFCPGDQPLLRRETLRLLAAQFQEDPSRILRLGCDGIPGMPVIFPARFYPELQSLPDGKGGSAVMHAHPEAVTVMKIEDPLQLRDADTPEALRELEEAARASRADCE